jgi:SulP family sulfate permease
VAAQPGGWKIEPVRTRAQMLPGLLIYRFSHGMYYANAQMLSEEVTKLVKEAKPALAWFCIDAGAVDDVDYSAAATLRRLQAHLKERGIRLVFSEVSTDVYRQLQRSEITDLVGQDAFFAQNGEVIQAYKEAHKIS